MDALSNEDRKQMAKDRESDLASDYISDSERADIRREITLLLNFGTRVGFDYDSCNVVRL